MNTEILGGKWMMDARATCFIRRWRKRKAITNQDRAKRKAITMHVTFMQLNDLCSYTWCWPHYIALHGYITRSICLYSIFFNFSPYRTNVKISPTTLHVACCGVIRAAPVLRPFLKIQQVKHILWLVTCWINTGAALSFLASTSAGL